MNILLDKIEKANNVAITGHIRPDGDCTGSCLGLYNYIKDNYESKNVVLYLEKPSLKFSYMRGYHDIDSSLVENNEFKDIAYDLLICLDAADKLRLDNNAYLLEISKDSLAIDHHITHKKYTNSLVLQENASSTCELITSLLDMQKISKETATCLYTGIIHDTGVFKYENTSLKTMELAGMLMQKGVEYSRIIDESFFSRSFKTTKVLAKVLADARLLLDNKMIVSYTSLATMKEFDIEKKDLDGIIDELRNVEGIEVALYLYELEQGLYKISLRSKNYVNVARICEDFFGGGHIRAAGCSISGDLEKIIQDITIRVKEQI